MSTIDKIRAIFYSSAHAFTASEELVQEIAFLVDEGYLRYKEFSISTKEEYLEHIGAISRKGNYDADGGGVAHIALKKLAAVYISRTYGRDVRFEAPFCGYYPDVLSVDKKLVVECGQTSNPDKMLAYFNAGNITECIQIPYPDVDDTHIQAYSFTARDDLKEFLAAVESSRRASLKSMITRRG